MRILTITSPDINNGLGNRVTLWVAGCPHHCPGCHNQHTWEYKQGLDITLYKNYELVLGKLREELSKPIINGLTLSGGDPLGQSDDVLNELLSILMTLKREFPNKDIWVYSGDVYENLIKNPIIQEILNLCDVLVDGPFILDKKDTTIPFRGSTNQRIIDLKKTLDANEIVELPINEKYKYYR